MNNLFGSDDESRRLANMLEQFKRGPHVLTPWESGFLRDLAAERLVFKTKMSALSPKQLAKLDDIEKKFTLIPRFLDRMCNYNADCEWPFDDLYYAFRDWAKGNGITCFHPKADFEKELQNRDFEIEMRKSGLVVIGIELLAQQPRPVSRNGYGRRSTSRSRR